MERPFFLAAKAVVLDPSGRWLLLKRSPESENGRGKWDLPGGKIEPGESFGEALLREVREETGLEVRLGRVVGAAESEVVQYRMAYLILTATWESGEVRLSHEHDDYRWVEPARLGSLNVCSHFRPFIEAFLPSQQP